MYHTQVHIYTLQQTYYILTCTCILCIYENTQLFFKCQMNTFQENIKMLTVSTDNIFDQICCKRTCYTHILTESSKGK